MYAITVEEIKANSRIDCDDEDVLLEQIGEAAEQMVENGIRRSMAEVEADYGGVIPAPLKRASLMLADHLYTNRGATGTIVTGTLPMGVQTMIRPYILLK